MAKELQLVILKQDLERLDNTKDDYLQNLLEAAKQFIEREGLILADSYEDDMLIAMYAAFLYRKRAQQSDVAMPTFLRLALNNRLLSQKAGGVDAV